MCFAGKATRKALLGHCSEGTQYSRVISKSKPVPVPGKGLEPGGAVGAPALLTGHGEVK